MIMMMMPTHDDADTRQSNEMIMTIQMIINSPSLSQGSHRDHTAEIDHIIACNDKDHTAQIHHVIACNNMENVVQQHGTSSHAIGMKRYHMIGVQ